MFNFDVSTINLILQIENRVIDHLMLANFK